MDVSVAICTRNRSDLLRQTLACMRDHCGDELQRHEVLLVDNGSTDQTRGVVEEFAQDLPIRYLFEDKPGHTIARNRAIAAANGEVILWTDDDVLVPAGWVQRYIDAAARWPQASFFGGSIAPMFEVPPPAWLNDVWHDVAGYYAVREFGDEEFECDQRRIPFGANFAIRAEVQRQYLFDEHLGRRGRQLSAGDETTLLRQIMSDGHTGRWVAGTTVQHFIPKERLTASYLWGNYYHHGRRSVAADRDLSAAERWRAIARHAYRGLRSGLACTLTRRQRHPQQWLARFRSASMQLGQASGLYGAQGGVGG